MALAALRSTLRKVQFSTFGVAASVRVPGQPAVSTTIIWLTPISDDKPLGSGLPRREIQRAVAIRRDDVPSVPRGTVITVAEHLADASGNWVVDSLDAIFEDHHRVTVRVEG